MSKVIVTQYETIGNIQRSANNAYRNDAQIPGRVAAREEVDGGGEVTILPGVAFIKIKAVSGDSTFAFTGEPAEQDADYISEGESLFHAVSDQQGVFFTAVTFTDVA